MPKVIAEDSNDDIARNLWRTARLIRPSHPVQARVLRLQQRLDAVTGQLAQAKRLTATLPLALQALELRLE